MIDAVKSPNDTHSGKTFIQHEIYFIDFRLHSLKERDSLAHDRNDRDEKDRNGPDQYPC